MHRIPDTVKTLIAAVTIAFASTVSAMHVHDINTYSHSSLPVVQNLHDLHDCIFFWVVYQTIIVDSDHARLTFSGSDALIKDQPAAPLTRFSFDWYGRAPPFPA